MTHLARRLILGLILVFISVNNSLCAQEITPDTVALYRGHVTVDIVRGRGIAVGIDLPARDALVGDGIFDRMIVLEAFGRIPPEFPLVLPDAYVAVSAGRAMVVELGGPRLVELIVELPTRRGGLEDGVLPSEVRLARNWRGKEERTRFVGVGLVNAEVQAPVIDDGSWLEGGLLRDACSAGSTSCSITCNNTCQGVGCASHCSTTCSTGFYACCKCLGSAVGASCSCLTSGGGGGGSGGGSGGGGGACSSGGGACPAECFNCTQAF